MVPRKRTSHFNQAVSSYVIISRIPIRGENFRLQVKQISTSESVRVLYDTVFAIKTSSIKAINVLFRR